MHPQSSAFLCAFEPFTTEIPTRDDKLGIRLRSNEAPSIAEFLTLLGPARAFDAAALIYHAFCLAEAAGLNPDPASYVKRFPVQGRSLERLFCLHQAFDTSQFQLWADPAALPEVGDQIGPFLLLRELGEGGFARVFLA